MAKKTCVRYSDIFRYANKKHGIDWNRCNDLFFSDTINYKGATSFYKLDGVDAETLGLKDYSYEEEDDQILIDAIIAFVPDKDRIFKENGRIKDHSYANEAARIIINQFMIDEKLDDEILILGD